MGFAKLSHERQDFLTLLLKNMGINNLNKKHYKMVFLHGVLEIDNDPFTAERFADFCRDYGQNRMITSQQASMFILLLRVKGYLLQVESIRNRKQHILTSKMYQVIEVTKNESKIQKERKRDEDND